MARIAISGATGLIGGLLAASLEEDGHTVVPITRSPAAAGAHGVVWDPQTGRIDGGRLEGVDAAVHLAAEPAGERRWTSRNKRLIVDSRRDGTRLLAQTLADLDDPPVVLVSASAVGYYGDRGDEVITEDTPRGDDFLAQVCEVWEESAEPARAAGIRVVHSRTGVVIAREGPLIEKVELPFRLGLGGKVGPGRQYVPWVSMTDEIRALRFLIDRDDLHGPVNLVAPEPVPNAELTRALGEALGRWTPFRIPLAAIWLLYGEMGYSLARTSQRVIPQRLLDAGFEFTHGDIRSAARVALAR